MANLSNTAAPSVFSPLAPPLSDADELELTRLYRDHYPALLSAAKRSLGGELEHYAGKIAQAAMLDVWARRTEFSSPGAFDAALDEAVRAEAAVQRQKHAALRTRGAARVPHVKPLSTDEAVAQLISTLHQAPVDHDAALAAARETSKHHAAEHVQHVGQPRSWLLPVIIVAALLLVGMLGSRFITGAGGESAVRKALAADDARSLSAARGQRGNVELADGTRARIGSDSRIRMPNAFGTTMRTAQVEGAASFTVAADKPQPFTVWAGNAIITATGTRFTVRAFPDEQHVVVAVDEGSVSVRAKNESDAIDVSAGQAVRVAQDGKITGIDGAAKEHALAWVRDSLAFTDMPARDVLSELSRWFALNASFADSALGERPVTLRLGLESSGTALEQFAKAAGLTVGFDKDKVVLSAASPR